MRNSNRIPDVKKPRTPVMPHPHSIAGHHHPHDADLVHGFNSGKSPMDINLPDHNPMGPPRKKPRVPEY